MQYPFVEEGIDPYGRIIHEFLIIGGKGMISYQSIAQECVSFYEESHIPAGQPCKMHAADTVTKALKGEAFIGIVVNSRELLANVVVRGFVTVKYSGDDPTVGMVGLCGGDNGTVAVSETAPTYLVVSVDTKEKTVTFLL